MRTGSRTVWSLVACLCVASLVGLAGLAPTARAEDNGLAPTPPMGWNDWYSAYCSVSAQLVAQAAQAMVSDGMKAAGYDYVNIDDCWMAPSRDSAGNLVPDPTRFPQGIKPVADYVHSLGLRLGIYEDAGTATCAEGPGSYGHEAQDAATFASWGVDYVKYDRCSIPYADFPGQSQQQVQRTLYARMSSALRATGRAIVFSMANPDPGDDPWGWAGSIANLWRTTPDIEDNYGSMLGNFQGTVDKFAEARPGAWNDPDLLQIGNGGSTTRDYQTEFSLWAEMAAPLIASTNLAALTPAELAIYENRDVIAVDQDPLGRQGVPVSRARGLWVLTKPLADGGRAVLLFNSTETAAPIATSAAAVGLAPARAYRLEDLWSDSSVTETGGGIRAFVPAHGVVMYRVAPVIGPGLHGLPPRTSLSLTPANPQLALGRSTIVRETFANDGVSPVKGLVVYFWVRPGWQLKRLGPARAARVAGGHGFTVAFRVTAPIFGEAVTLAPFVGSASWDPPAGHTSHDPPAGRAITWANLGEQVLSPVLPPFETANRTAGPARFGASYGALAISSRGTGVFQPVNAPPTDSYAALYLPGAAGRYSTAQVTVTSDPAGGVSGGAGLIERDAMTAPPGSPAGVVLFVSNRATIEMAWNVTGGRDVDSRFELPGVTVATPVTLRLVRSGRTYTGYYSTDEGVTWVSVDSVTVAASAAAGNQDVGAFHASGLPTWTTTATFTDLTAG
jgi:alpha-galactosidase